MYYSLDFGGTNYRISWTSSLNKIKTSSPNVEKIKNTGNYVLDVGNILSCMMSKKTNKAKGISIALPGQFDYEKFELKYALHLKHWQNKSFFNELGKEFGCLPKVNKDTVVAGFGEGEYGETGFDKFLYMSWGTGVGGCVIKIGNGRIPIVYSLDWKETFEEIEYHCGGGNAQQNFGRKLELLDDKQWKLLVQDFVIDTQKISELLNIRDIVLGGGVTAKRGEIVSQIQNLLKERGINLKKSRLGDNSAIYGGYVLLSTVR